MGLGRLIQFPEQFWKRFHSQGLILLYHRVTHLDNDPQLLTVTPDHFAEHLEYIEEYYQPISLPELTIALKSGKIPDKCVAITFDDGYADNFQNAKPLLEKYGIPATVFITTGYVATDREFWWDDLERILLLPDRLPDHLELTIQGKKRKWNLTNGEMKMTENKNKKGSSLWNTTMAYDPSPHYVIYWDLHRLLKPLSHELQDSIISKVAQWAGVPRTGRATHRSLTFAELKSLDKGDLIEIGSHTMSHTMLSKQPINIQKEEIFKSKNFLEEALDHEISNFSYPYGGRADFNKTSVDIVKKAGFSTACANYGSTIIRTTDSYRLPRVLVRDWNMEVFSSRIKEWFNE